jgi:hypothetical protein
MVAGSHDRFSFVSASSVYPATIPMDNHVIEILRPALVKGMRREWYSQPREAWPPALYSGLGWNCEIGTQLREGSRVASV